LKIKIRRFIICKIGYLFKIYQITNYNSLNKINIKYNENEVELIGYIDCIDIDNNIIYEFKCDKQMKNEYYLQLAFYMYELKNLIHMKDIVINQI
jgi:hypothetical protein